MLRVDHEHELVLVERDRLQLRMAERPAEPDLHLLAEHELEHFLRVPGADRQGDLRVRAPEPGQDPGEDVGTDRGGRAERELARLAPGELGEQPAPARDAVERPLGVGEERATGVRQAHSALGADEELRIELLLEPLDASGKRRLRGVQSVRGPADAPQPRDLDECFQLLDSHIETFYRSDRNKR